MGLLDGELASIVGDAAAFLFLNAALTHDVPNVGSDPADPPPPTSVIYPCLAIEEEWSAEIRGAGLVGATDIQVLILANSLPTVPLPLDRITIRGRTVTIVPGNTGGLKSVQSDPARATWLCRCMS